MKVVRLFAAVSVVTGIALLYVHQQVELIKLSYAIDNREGEVSYLLDRREKLIYNLNNLESPSRLEKGLLAKKKAFDFPAKGQLIRTLETPAAESRESIGVASFPGRLLMNITQFLGLSREAQAKER